MLSASRGSGSRKLFSAVPPRVVHEPVPGVVERLLRTTKKMPEVGPEGTCGVDLGDP